MRYQDDYDDEIDLDELDGVGAVDIVGAAAVAHKNRFTIDMLAAGFPISANIAAGGTDTTTLTPARPIRAQHLVLDAAFTVAACAVQQVLVGAVNQNIGNGPLPGRMFTEQQQFRLKGDTIQPATGAQLTLLNNTAGAITNVSKAIVGPAAVAG